MKKKKPSRTTNQLKNKLKLINQARGQRPVLPTKVVPDKKKKIKRKIESKESKYYESGPEYGDGAW